ncbi:MAG: hypothetical protein ISR64_00980 [Deltaproteobacteria bacterium]|nr:hypothetical protein [Deltaproteobacteria bacterium]
MKSLHPIIVAAAAGLILAAAGCQSEAERLHADSLYHLEKVLYILEHSEGKNDVAMAELDKYLEKHGKRLAANRADGKRIMGKMSEAERDRFARTALEKSRPVKERIDTVVRTFSDTARIFRKLRELL